MQHPKLKHAVLLTYLRYEPNTGKFFFRVNKGSKREGDEAGSPDGYGYIRIQFSGKTYCAHELAWYYVHGEWPTTTVRHVNGDKSDNRIVNLHVGYIGEIRSLETKSATGFRWVTEIAEGSFEARVGKRYVGLFRNQADAHNAALSTVKQLGSDIRKTAHEGMRRRSPLG